MRAAIYARVSTDEDRKLQDPESQLRVLRKYAEIREFEITREFVEYKSGMDDNRQVLAEMLRQAELERKPFDAIIVFKTDRITRKAYTLFDVFKRLKAAKVTMISVEESLDTSSMYSEGMMLMLGIVAGWEREGIVQRINAGVQRAKKQGTRSGKPFGRPRRGTETKGARKEVPDLHKILEIIRSEPSVSQAELSRRTCIPRSTLLRYLSDWAVQNEGVAEYISKHKKNGDDH
jgi:DNA invertase Pin-like site-specific DNA recombinase